jgi:SAM-dependent methyltransferase
MHIGYTDGIAITDKNWSEVINFSRKIKNIPNIPDNRGINLNLGSDTFKIDCINISFFDGIEYDLKLEFDFKRFLLPFKNESINSISSINFLQKIQSDCILTHFFQSIYNLLIPGGFAYIVVPNFHRIVNNIVNCSNEVERIDLEKLLFSESDSTGIFYSQNFIDILRIKNRAKYAGFKDIIELNKSKNTDKIKLYTVNTVDLYPEQLDLKKKADAISKGMCALRYLGCKQQACLNEYHNSKLIYCEHHSNKAKRLVKELNSEQVELKFRLTKGER